MSHLIGIYSIFHFCCFLYLLSSIEIFQSEKIITENIERTFCKIVFFIFIVTYGVLLLLTPKNIIPSIINFVSYIYYFPTFYLCGTIYSFCSIENYLFDKNLKDKEQYLITRYKLNFIMKWILSNICFAYIIKILLNSEYEYHTLIVFILISTILIIGRSIGAILFHIKHYIYDFPIIKNRLNSKINEYYHFRIILENFLEKQKIRSYISQLNIENENQDSSSLNNNGLKNNKPRMSTEEKISEDLIIENNKNFGEFFVSEVIDPNEK